MISIIQCLIILVHQSNRQQRLADSADTHPNVKTVVVDVAAVDRIPLQP
jgi:hypothetical protein